MFGNQMNRAEVVYTLLVLVTATQVLCWCAQRIDVGLELLTERRGMLRNLYLEVMLVMWYRE